MTACTASPAAPSESAGSTDNGNSVLLELAYPGDTIGYRSFLTGSEHKTSAEALGPSVVCHIDRATITALLAGNPALGLRFLKRSIGELEARARHDVSSGDAVEPP